MTPSKAPGTVTVKASGDSQTLFYFRYRYPALLLLILSLIAAAVTTGLAQKVTQSRSEQKFLLRAGEITANFDKELHLYVDVLRGFQSLYAASKSVERDEFAAYARGLKLERLPGLMAIEFVQRVPKADLEAFTAAVRNDTSLEPEGYPSFRVFPEGPRDDYFVVTYMETNGRVFNGVLGFDVGSEPARRRAAELARDTAQPAVTHALTLIVDQADPQPGFLIFLPVYSNKLPHQSVQQRRETLLGYILGVFRAREAIASMLSSMGSLAGIGLEIFEGIVSDKKLPLYDSGTAYLDANNLTDKLQRKEILEFASKQWLMVFTAERGFGLNRFERLFPWVVLFIGFVFSILIFIAFYGLTGSRQRALNLAQKMTADIRASEAHFRSLIANAQDIITVMSATGVIQFQSPAVERILGFTPEEMIGKSVFDFMHPEDKARTLAVLASAIPFPGATRNAVFRYRNKRGEWRVLEAIGSNQLMEPSIKGIVVNSRDITERQQEQARFRGLLESAPDAMVISNEDGQIVMVNAQAEALFGYTRQAMLSQKVDMLMPERFRGKHEEYRRGFFINPSSRPMGLGRKLLGCHKDGREFPIEISLSPLKTAEGTLVTAAIRDISEREEATRRIQESSARFSGLVSNIPGAVYRCACDSDWTMEFISEAVSAFSGYEAGDFIKNSVRTYASIIHPDDRLLVERVILDAVERREAYNLEYRIIHADGSTRWVHGRGRGSYSPDDEIAYLDGVIFDMTGRKTVEEALKQREAQFRAISESSPLGIFVTDSQGQCTYVNLRYHEIAGTSLNEALGRGWEKAIHPDDRPRVIEQWYSSAKRNARYESIHRFLHKGGQALWAHVLAASMRDGDTMLGYVGTVEDITDRKKAEDELQNTYWELKEAQSQLVQSEKLASIGQLAAGVAHEVKNPLAIVAQGLSYLDVLPVITDGQDKEILQMMRNAVQRADKIIRGLLDFARPAQVELKKVSIGELLVSSLELVRTQLVGNQVSETISIDPKLPHVLADENQMRQVFINLFTNAFQAMPQGGKLALKAYLRQVTEKDLARSHRKPSGWNDGQQGVWIEVNDTGMGIPKHLLNRIWDPFFTTKPTGQGTGLGLSVTQALLEAHRGLFIIESEEGNGTLAIVVLPVEVKTDG